MRFAKTEAYGNDFILVAHEHVDGDPSQLACSMCDRLRGVGGDGLILFRTNGGKFEMTLFNSDGSSAEISGNGLRCLASYLRFAGLAPEPVIEVETGAGRLRLEELGREGTTFQFRADMGPPGDVRTDVVLDVAGRTIQATTLSMGNPHCVVFTNVGELREIGPVLESHSHFPDRANVELVEVMNRQEIRMAIWERGAGETASSGTGSAASAVAAIVDGHTESPVRVHCPGGTIEVAWTEGSSVFVTGEAVVVAEGDFLLDWRKA